VERGYDEEIEEKILKLDLVGKVRLLPPAYDQEKWLFIKNAKAVIYPTLEEPFGRVPFEAVSAGSFPIIPDQSGSAEYLRPFIPQCIYRHQKADSLVATMFNLEKAGPKALQALEEAREWVRRDLNWERVAGSVMNLYGEILLSKSRGLTNPSTVSETSIVSKRL
jgi:glycosyltransferase involved in cell wall biosynthesis